MTVDFFETKMLHWPDSMFSFIREEGVLVSQDAFGMHLASVERFADELPDWILDYEAKKYYGNILSPYSPLILKLFDRIQKAGLDIRIILPDHGPVWRQSRGKILDFYQTYAKQKPSNKALVVYDTMWNSTEIMARAVAEGIGSTGCPVDLLHIRVTIEAT